MALVAERWGLIPELQGFAAQGRPIWGTCAGLIFLANRATGMKEGGQALLGGLDCMVHRNFFGAQINSFETQLPAPACLRAAPAAGGANGTPAAAVDPATFRAVFIRAPAITEAGPGVEVLAEYRLTPEEAAAQGRDAVIVADTRWHELFVEMVRRQQATAAEQQATEQQQLDLYAKLGRAPNRPADLPVYTR
eukprot:scaffold7.g3479.t1